MSYGYMVMVILTKVSVEVWEEGDIATTKSNSTWGTMSLKVKGMMAEPKRSSKLQLHDVRFVFKFHTMRMLNIQAETGT